MVTDIESLRDTIFTKKLLQAIKSFLAQGLDFKEASLIVLHNAINYVGFYSCKVNEDGQLVSEKCGFSENEKIIIAMLHEAVESTLNYLEAVQLLGENVPIETEQLFTEIWKCVFPSDYSQIEKHALLRKIIGVTLFLVPMEGGTLEQYSFLMASVTSIWYSVSEIIDVLE